jgi:MFS family permease
LNDTGLLGLVLFSVFGIAVAARAWSGRKNPIVLGLGQMAVVVALANLATETSELMIGWLLIGILLAACDVASTAAPPRRPAPAEVRST